jgi:hypothetical protein
LLLRPNRNRAQRIRSSSKVLAARCRRPPTKARAPSTLPPAGPGRDASTDSGGDSGGIGGAAIAGIIIGVLILIVAGRYRGRLLLQGEGNLEIRERDVRCACFCLFSVFFFKGWGPILLTFEYAIYLSTQSPPGEEGSRAVYLNKCVRALCD